MKRKKIATLMCVLTLTTSLLACGSAETASAPKDSNSGSGNIVTAVTDYLNDTGISKDSAMDGGYIQFTDDDNLSKEVKKVKLFTEKPEYEMALQFIKSGDFLWNAGIFIWSLSSIEKSMKQFLPEIYELFNQGVEFYDSEEEENFIDVTYSACPSISIDYGVMEKASNVYVIPSSFGWSDIGTWNALYEQREKDENANSYIGKNVMTYEVNNCLINTPKDKLVILQGLEDYIVVDSDDILMVCHKSEEQRIKQFVTDVEVEKGNDYL